VSDEEKAERHRSDTPNEVGGSIHDSQTAGQRHGTDRMGQIDLKDPPTPTTSASAPQPVSRTVRRISPTHSNHLSGRFYSIEGEYLGQNEYEYKRMLAHGITYPNGFEIAGRQKPFPVCNVKELANFITVPSIDSLPKASRAGTGGTPKAQSPLTSPNEEVFREFSHGMTIGRAVTAIRDPDLPPSTSASSRAKRMVGPTQPTPRNRPLRQRPHPPLHPRRNHRLREDRRHPQRHPLDVREPSTAQPSSSTPKAAICARTTCGVIAPSSATSMTSNTSRSPRKTEWSPASPSSTCPSPLVEAGGRERATAVQNIVDHYFQVLYFALGKDTVDQAFVANEILTNLIKACFDPVYGSDHFSIGELLETAQDFQEHGAQVGNNNNDDLDDKMLIDKALPKVSDNQVESILLSHLQKDQRQFMNTTDAVLNRIRKLKERDFIWDMLSFDVADEHWDHEAGWYDREVVPMLDLKSVLNSDKVILIDTGDIHGESSKMFTVLFLSHLWTSVRSIWTPNDDDYIANVIIEESADVARTEIVYEDLLPKGREFNLSLGLIMQYPEQVLGTTHGRTGGPTRRSSTTSTPRSSGTSRPTICSRNRCSTRT